MTDQRPKSPSLEPWGETGGYPVGSHFGFDEDFPMGS